MNQTSTFDSLRRELNDPASEASKTSYVYVERNGSILGGLVKDASTFGMLLICVGASSGSAWWTFFNGAIMVALVLARLMLLVSGIRRFTSRQDLLTWLHRSEGDK